MRALGVRPYPMVYQQVGTAKSGNDLDLRKLKDFQRWVIRRHYHVMPFEDYLKAPKAVAAIYTTRADWSSPYDRATERTIRCHK